MKNNREEYVGKVFKTNKCGDVLVVEYKNHKNVKVRFLNTGTERIVRLDNLKSGAVKDKLSPSVMGVGVVTEQVRFGDKFIYEYQIWKSVLTRCYDNKYHKKHPTYKDCEVSENFKHFSYFKEWCREQTGFSTLDEKLRPFAIDKDILIRGNKLYSEDTCVFVPHEINNLFTLGKRDRGELPIGVSFKTESGRYSANISLYGKLHCLGYYTTPEEAFCVYKEAKEKYIKEIAEKWGDKIDVRVYESLMSWDVRIDD